MSSNSCMSWLRRAMVVVGLVAALAVPNQRAYADDLPDATDRVIGLGRVWAKVKFFHPYLAYKDIDWDAALLAAIPKAETATSVAEYRAAIQTMLAVLRDPVTRVRDEAPHAKPVPPSDWLTTPAPGVVEIKIAGFVTGGFDAAGTKAKAKEAIAKAAGAKVLIIDMRAPTSDLGQFEAQYAVDALGDALPAIDEWPRYRSVEHRGFRTQEGSTSGGYYSEFATSGVEPAKPATKQSVPRAVFIVDPDAFLPDAAIALQAAGRGAIVARGVINSETNDGTTKVELPGHLTAEIRLTEPLWGALTADATVASDRDLEPRALALAKAFAAGTSAAKPRKPIPLPAFQPRNDLDYADQPYPSRELRMLAGIRLWAVLDTLNPYRYLINDWDGALREALPRLSGAADREAYRKAVRLLAARAGDGHIGVYTATPDPDSKPRGMLPIELRLLEGRLVAVRALEPEQTKRLAIAPGDVIESIDGVPAAAALANLRPEISGSIDEARDQRVATRLALGDDGSTVALAIRGADGKLREVSATRTTTALAAWRATAGPHWKKLTNTIGYADLRALTVPDVAPMFDDFKDTQAIILDMRGYPNGTAWTIAPRINTRNAKYGAQFLMPLAVGAMSDADSRWRFLQTLPKLPDGASLYRGKIVVLIDDRAISQSEHSCLFFSEAAGATFIGSPTAGTNGDVTTMRLPGGLRMSFTGQEVRHVDGAQLQKVGIKPDVLIRPTIAGIRAGKDEVLDRALAWLAAHR